MNYERIYNAIIQNRINSPASNVYTEKHHIVPKSLGGSDSSENLVRLTAREHFICHWLLVKIHRTGPYHHKMVKALQMMIKGLDVNNRYKPKSYFYAKQRERLSATMSASQKGKGNSQFGKKWYSNPETLSTQKFIPAEVSNGWIRGRIVNWDQYFAQQNQTCEVCGSVYSNHRMKRTCSDQCKRLLTGQSLSDINKEKIEVHNHLRSHAKEILEKHEAGMSISQICRHFNVKPAGKWFYIVKEIIGSPTRNRT